MINIRNLCAALRWATLAAVIASLVVLAALFPADGARAAKVPNTGASFGIQCKPAKIGKIDPVMLPGVGPNDPRQMMHRFFGSRAVDKDTTTGKSLRGTPTTCAWKDNSSSYWFPAVQWINERTGERYNIKPGQMNLNFYYKAGHINGAGFRRVEPFPPGTKLLAGAEGAQRMNPRTNDAHVTYRCLGVTSFSKYPPERCRASGNRDKPVLQVSIAMPECLENRRKGSTWNFRNKPADVGVCKPDETQVPEIRWFLNLDIPKAANSKNADGDVRVHMGPAMGGWRGPRAMHGDFMNGWRQPKLNELVDRCINKTPKREIRPDSCRSPRPFKSR